MAGDGRGRARARRLRPTTAAAVLIALWTSGPAVAQTFDNRPPILRRGGGGGVGVGAAIGLGLGLLGAAAAARAADEEPSPPRRGREPRRVRPITVDDDMPPETGRRGDRPPPKVRAPRAPERPPTAKIAIPAKAETRFIPGEVLVEVRGNGPIGPIAARLGATVVESRPLRLTGSTLHRLAARDGRSTAELLLRLRRERTIAFAQPNWVYTLQQEAAAVAAPAERAAPEAAPVSTDGPAVPPEQPVRTEAAAEIAAPSAPVEVPPSPALAAPAAPAATAAAVVAPLSRPAEPPPPMPGQYAAEKLRLPAAHDRVRGRAVRVAVIDTGADANHPELAGAVEARFDALSGVDPAPGAHGTAMAGAIAARLRLSGAAPAARLLTARAFGPPAANGVAQGSTFHVVACLDWAVETGARVVSMSFAGPSSGALSRAIAAAEARGVVAVAAAGNAGPQSPPLFPAADPAVIAVTASDPDDHVLAAANRGGHVAVTAPGVDILVASPQGGYDLTSGTSVAAAEVAGVVALLLETRADLGPREVRRILTETAIDLGPRGRDPIFGAGLVDAAAAVEAAARRR